MLLNYRMRKYNKLFFSVFIFLVACQGNNVPDGIIEQKKMTNLLTEIHIVDGSMYNVLQIPDTLYKYGMDRYLKVFKKYHTDSVEFKKSFRYYTTRPEILETMYDQIMKNIQMKSDSVNKLSLDQIAKDNKRRTDSLNKIKKNTPAQPAMPVQAEKSSPKQELKLPHKIHKRRHVDSLP
jgi:hypothetical protein